LDNSDISIENIKNKNLYSRYNKTLDFIGYFGDTVPLVSGHIVPLSTSDVKG